MAEDKLFGLVNKALEKLEPLWNGDNFDALEREYQKLYEVCPDHPEILRKMQQLKIERQQKQNKEYDAYIKNSLAKIRQLITAEKFDQAIKACHELLEVDKYNTEGEKLLQTASEKFIDQKLELRSAFDQKDYKKLYSFYKGLEYIKPNHKILKKLLLDTQTHLLELEKKERQEKINKLVNIAENYFKDSEYEKAHEVCLNMSKIDPSAPEVKKLIAKLKKAETSKKERQFIIEMSQSTQHAGTMKDDEGIEI